MVDKNEVVVIVGASSVDAAWLFYEVEKEFPATPIVQVSVAEPITEQMRDLENPISTYGRPVKLVWRFSDDWATLANIPKAQQSGKVCMESVMWVLEMNTREHYVGVEVSVEGALAELDQIDQELRNIST